MTEKNKEKEIKPSQIQKAASSYRSGWAYAEAPLQYGLTIVVCVLIGYWLDNVFNTGSILLIAGVIIGASAGFIGLLKSLKAYNFNKYSDRDKKDQV
ncbi:MAG: AtpZ/AtpI family protein [Ignavibacteria bacterium]|jgi:F0F1-type ATP synthase assembly protein I